MRASFRPAVGLAMALLASVPGTARAEEPLVLVIAATSPVVDLSSADVRRLFQGYPIKGPDGTRLIPINQPPASEARVVFDERVLEMSPREVGQYWVDRRIREGAVAPRTQASEPVLIEVVAKLPGAVSYVHAAALTPEVRALNIDDLPPSDPKFLLAPETPD